MLEQDMAGITFEIDPFPSRPVSPELSLDAGTMRIFHEADLLDRCWKRVYAPERICHDEGAVGGDL